ncbi:hypothetical protein ISCU110981_19730 [Isoptericola cucumis]
MTRAHTPNATTDVNRDARRNDAFITSSRTGSSCGSWAYVWPSAIPVACMAMTSACA